MKLLMMLLKCVDSVKMMLLIYVNGGSWAFVVSMNGGIGAMTDTLVFNPVIASKVRVVRFTSTLWQSHDVHEIQRIKEALLERK